LAHGNPKADTIASHLGTPLYALVASVGINHLFFAVEEPPMALRERLSGLSRHDLITASKFRQQSSSPAEWGGNRQANATLHRISVVRLRWHEQIRAYAERRKAEGFNNEDILRRLKRFFVREAFDL
jgi:hypothetical protein